MDKKAAGILKERRHKWQSKEILRKLYHKWYSQIGEWVRPGVVLELGGGSGNLKEHFPGAITSDVVFAPWLDAVLDAQRIPLRSESVTSIVLFDVLHHLPAPALFFSEAQRVLKREGRIVLMEPYVSTLSSFIYKYFHQEGMKRDGNPLGNSHAEGRDPFEGNQALPCLIFEDYREDFLKRFPGLKIIREERMDFLIYPLSGGFHHPSLCPISLYRLLERMEHALLPLGPYLAFRVLLVLEKSGIH